MKNVMFVCCNFTWGGVEQYILNIIDNIDRERYNISVLLPNKRKYDHETALIQRSVPIYKLSGGKMKVQLKEYKNIIENEKIDIVHLTLGYPAYFYAKTAFKTNAERIIIHSHTSKTGREHLSILQRIMRKLLFIYSNKFICRKTINLACSDLAAEYMFSHSQKVEVLWNGIDIEKFKNEKAEDSVYIKYGIDKNKTNILSIGRMDPQKNPLFLIRVFNELVKLNPDYNLIYVGTGYLKGEIDELEDRLNIKNSIIHIPSTNKVSKLMKCADAFLLPSLYEGSPLVLLEAQAAGLRSFLSDTVSDLSDCGLCKFINLDIGEKRWAQEIDREIKNPDTKLMIDENKLNKFSIQTTVKRLEQIYG